MTAFVVPANLAFDSYSELVAAINDWLDRADLTGVAQQMIALCEARLRRLLVPYFSETSATIVTDASGVGGLPSDYGTANRVRYSTYTLPNVSSVAGANIGPGTSPVAYSIEGGSLKLWPEGAYTVTLLYQPLLPQLSDGSPTNDLLSAHPDMYFFGSLMFANGYLANDQRAALFKSLWDEAIDECKRYLTRQRQGCEMTPRLGFVP